MKPISGKLARPGDVILYPANGKSALSSRLVAAGEILAGFGGGLEQYSHAAILAATPGFQFEATFPRTCFSPVDISRPYEIWNVGDPSPAQRNRILRWCKENVGRWYNLIGVLTADFIRLPGTYYCSQFAGTAYAAAGLAVGDAIMTPDSIPDTPGSELVWRYIPKGGPA